MRPDRLPALAGLRGVAALVVAVHHSLLLSPALAAHVAVDLRDHPVDLREAPLASPAE